MKLHWRIGMLLHLPRIVECGLHSNIPWHCVLWFTLVDWPLGMEMDNSVYAAKLFFRYRQIMATRTPKHGYIPCPVCLLRRRVPNVVRRCDATTCVRKVWVLQRRKERTA